LAQALGYRYVDSGALYRAVAWKALHAKTDPGDDDAVARMLADFQPQVTANTQGFHVAVAGMEITPELRTSAVTEGSSRVATQPRVREWVNRVLKDLAQEGGMVAEGRDLGSVVFPDAEVKFYLDADLATRASRRQREWQAGGGAPGLTSTQNTIAARDHQDKTRKVAPLTVPQGAHYLDTTHLRPDEVAKRCLALIRENLGARAINI